MLEVEQGVEYMFFVYKKIKRLNNPDSKFYYFNLFTFYNFIYFIDSFEEDTAPQSNNIHEQPSSSDTPTLEELILASQREVMFDGITDTNDSEDDVEENGGERREETDNRQFLDNLRTVLAIIKGHSYHIFTFKLETFFLL